MRLAAAKCGLVLLLVLLLDTVRLSDCHRKPTVVRIQDFVVVTFVISAASADCEDFKDLNY